MARIALKVKPGTLRKDLKSNLYSTLGDKRIYPWKVIEGQNNYIIIIKDEQVEEIIEETTKEELNKIGLEVTIPPEYNSKRTIVIKDIDKHVDNYNNDELIADLENLNQNLKVKEVIRMNKGNYRALKVRLDNMQMAQKAIKEGVLICNQSIPPRQVEQELFVKIIPCYNCYAYTHKTKDCPKERMIKCTNCAEEGHNYENCTSPTSRCINCNQPHKTLQAKCPIRKKIIRDEIERIKAKKKAQPKSFADAAATPNVQNMSSIATNLGALPQNAATTIMTAVITAHIEELTTPGTFQRTVDKIYQLNGLTRVQLPDDLNHEGFKRLVGLEGIIQKMKENTGTEIDSEIDDDIEITEESNNEMEDSDEEITAEEKHKRKYDILSPSSKEEQLNPRDKKVKAGSQEVQTKTINLNDLSICMYVQKSRYKCIKSEKVRKKILEQFTQGKIKATWRLPEWTSEGIINLIMSNIDKGIVENIKFKRIEDREYVNLVHGFAAL